VRRALAIAAAATAGLWLLGTATAAGAPDKWEDATEARLALTDAETELILGTPATARAQVERAAAASMRVLSGHPALLREARVALASADSAAASGDERDFGGAQASLWTLIVRAGFLEATAAAARGDVQAARSWLLVREFRPPTRFTRAAADATLAIERLAERKLTPQAAAAAVRNDLLDTYEARLRASLDAVREAQLAGFDVRRSASAGAAAGYWAILRPAFVAQRGAKAALALDGALQGLRRATKGGELRAALQQIDAGLAGFRAAPLSPEEQLRRAGQLDRFLRLVPIEYARGVRDGRVVLDFEIQEAITFRDGAAGAFRDLEPILLARNPVATRKLARSLTTLGDALAQASRGDRVTAPDEVHATTDGALALIEATFPQEWRDAAGTADFDVISATLDRVQAAAAAGEWGRAEQARLEAYGVFELGPEQRLRGLAPGLFQEIEGLFWYGAGSTPGLVVLLERKAAAEELAVSREALAQVLEDAEARIGAGPGSRISVITNSAIIVFREGLEAVLILAALMASLVGAQRRHRRPLMAGVGVALVASVVTWIVAQTVLGSLAGWGERLEAVVSLVAIGVLLVILNWFYHRVYWQENLQQLHRRKKRILVAAGAGVISAQALGLVMLGFSSVYREGFETVLFLQALTLEAGAWTVLQGVALGAVGVLAVFFLVVALERRLPHKKMLMATGVMITWVLVVLVGQTVQTMQVVGWIPVTPIDGFRPPYWAGIWLGVYPTWQGLLAQTGAAVFVVGSYLAAEALRKRRRRRVIEGVQVPEIAVSRREAEPPVLAARTSASVVSRRGA
jgi:high-affinity iron transporter